MCLKSKLYIFTYHTRARGFIAVYGGLWAIMGKYGGFLVVSGGLSDKRSFCGRSERLRARLGAVSRAGVGGCTPAIMRARPIPTGLPPHSVRRWYMGECGE